MKKVIENDLKRIYETLSQDEKARLKDKSILITGGAGFVGRYLLSFLAYYKKELEINRIICIDNFMLGKPVWLTELADTTDIELYDFNIITDDIRNIPNADKVDYVYHMASIASPVYYRKHPIETLDANVWGLRKLLDFYKDKNISKLAFFSSSEVYGDPAPEFIPTSEDYRGNVDCKGPRACYDEAKRFGETMCYLYNQRFEMPIVIIRPFNNYGPGMKLNDARISADFSNSVRLNKDIVVLSDGKPTRTFCYISDTVNGYLKCLLYKGDFETFNIGSDGPEISVNDFAKVCMDVGKKVMNYSGSVRHETSNDKDYLSNNPTRRCPDISRARTLLGYSPMVSLEEGIEYLLLYIKESKEEELIW